MNAFQQEVIDMLGLKEEEISPLSTNEAELLYAHAYDIYQKKEYRSAVKLFSQLVVTNPFSLDYWKGLASAQQMAREYLAALHAWALTSILSENDPLPHMHAAECYFKTGESEEALKALDLALDLAQDRPDLIDRIHSLKAAHHAHHPS